MTGLTIADIARMAGGTHTGEGQQEISGFAPIDQAEAGALSFLSNPKYTQHLYSTKASAVLVERSFIPQQAVSAELIFVENVYQTLSQLLQMMNGGGPGKMGIEQPSHIGQGCQTEENNYIGAFAYIGDRVKLASGVQIYPHCFIGDDALIGENTIIYAGAKIYARTEIGRGCIIHSGAVIGSDGFGFARGADGSYAKVPQLGKVIIKDNVEIGANTTIDRATLNATVIGQGVKLDNLIQIAHNVEIGENTVMAAQAGVSGSTKVGAGSSIGGQVGIIGHINLAPGSQVAAQSGVASSLTVEDGKWFGSPAIEARLAARVQVVIKKLPELYRTIQTLETEMKKILEKEKTG